ncbi:unnamed protein product [Owenia fusiformis]|uniref:Uncharacterized protein n=1 Tax=Owenia fusiformis TaxID=6347 RepID=A0A8J1U171_OWEFU|nr:unnamed protein product [Owenia fusiformis]
MKLTMEKSATGQRPKIRRMSSTTSESDIDNANANANITVNGTARWSSDEPDTDNEISTLKDLAITTNLPEYNLRKTSILNRIETEQRRKLPKPPREKPSPPPLSKYRRRTANQRERTRMQEINDAFEDLRNAVPHDTALAQNGKMTKITTLRLALNYMHALRALLGYEDEDGADIPESPRSNCSSNSNANTSIDNISSRDTLDITCVSPSSETSSSSDSIASPSSSTSSASDTGESST